ncbi:MAG TPA: Ni/Fe hydrogenase subunit alpha [Devosiaceae bacterium]
MTDKSGKKTIKVDLLARVEGEGAFKVVVRNNKVERAELRIFEPPRFFEAMLRGRAYSEAPDITARICGICPVAYQMSSVHAMENVFGVKVEGQLRALRRLLYCGEWIESHVLHLAMLHAPDFLGYAGGIEMAKDHPAEVQLALDLKKAGNEIMTFVGGREIHPINVRVGGFYKVPRKRDLAPLCERLVVARDKAGALVEWVSKFDFPDHERDYVFVALRHPDEYPFNEGNIISNTGLDIPPSDYARHFAESHVPYSNALQAHMLDGRSYLCGPLARYNLNFEQLSERARDAAKTAGLGREIRNPYRSIVVRAVETLYAFDEAVRIIDAYEEPEAPHVDYEVKAGIGFGATEAPRGLLYHRYRLEADGTIAEANIVPPTSQNQASMEEDLMSFVGDMLDLPEIELQHRCEQTIRNYDPCISCATHFLKLEIDRG